MPADFCNFPKKSQTILEEYLVEYFDGEHEKRSLATLHHTQATKKKPLNFIQRTVNFKQGKKIIECI